MNLATLEVRIKDYEDAAAKAGKAAADRAALAGKLGGSDKVLKFVEAMPDPETFGKLIDKMPQTPPLDEVLAVFLPDDAAKFAGFVTQTLSGNLDALAALTGEGCGREPGNLKAFAAAFESDPKPLQDMMNEGGLGAHPGALAAMAGAMDPGRFKTLCGKFVNPTERGNLSAVLGTGGLALAPEALGALAAEDDGAMLKALAETITDPDDQTKLGDLVTRTAFAGTEPGRPGLLKDVIKDGLGNDPARLMELHAAFGCGTGAGAADLDRLVTGFDGTDGKAGRRMATLIGAFKSRDGSLSNQQLAEKMRDPYLTSITKLTVGAGASPVAGPDALDSLREAALAAPPPAPELVGATLAARLPADEAARLFVAGLAGPADRAAMETAALQAAGMKDMAAHLRPAAGETAPDDVTANEATVAATQAATDATKVLGGKADGGTPGEITALMALADEAIAAAALEQDPVARAAALDAAESAAKAVQGAMARAAAAAMARGGGGAVAMDAQKVLASLPAALPQAVKDAAGALAAQAMDAAAGAAACTAGAAAATEVAAAALATQKALGDPVPSDVTDAANTAADRAAAAATALVATLERAPRPVEPKLLAHAGSVAQSAQEAARGTADQAKAKAAFEAAGVLLAEITAAVRDGVQRFEALEARSSTTGKAALDKLAAAGASKGRADAALAPGTEGAILAGTTSDIEAASDAAMALTTYHAEADLDKKAQAIATAAAKDKHGDKASKVQIEQEADALKAAAEAARDDAGKAREALAKALPSADPAKFAALIVDAAAKGKAALEAGKGVVNDLARDDVFRAAQECLDAVETASKRPAFEVMRAAQAAQADLGTSGPAAQAAALAGAEADALESADKDEMQARAREIAARKDPGDVDGQVAKARIACVDATTAAEAAWDALSKIAPKPDSAAYAKAIKTLSDRLAGLMGAIPETEEDSVRDAGIAKAKACALEIAEATNALAAHHQEAAAKAAVTKQNSDMRAAGKATDTFATARNADVVFADSAATLAAGTKMKAMLRPPRSIPPSCKSPARRRPRKTLQHRPQRSR